jgi:tRNA threonylcarbamoyladenosine biosynthesis protein TsaE
MHAVHDNSLRLRLTDEAATQSLGARLAKLVKPGFTIYLSGDLGAGKTTLVRALLRALGYAGKVKSPTYTLVEAYAISNLNLYHFDLYRIREPREWLDTGFREHFTPETVCLVEWPEMAGDLLPPPDLLIRLRFKGQDREADIRAESPEGGRCIEALKRDGCLPFS